MRSDQLRCCIPGCDHSPTPVSLPECIEIMCEEHYALASPAAQARRARREKRLRVLQQCWDDDSYFDRLVASGKYLKMCSMLSLASEKAERAWNEIKTEVLDAAGSRGIVDKVRAVA